MSKIDYWLECLNCALEEIGAYNILTEDQKKSIAADLNAGCENIGLAFGGDFRPSKAEKSKEVLRLEERIKELEERDFIFRRAVATRRRVPVEDVYIESGDVKYDTLHRY